MYLVVLFTLYRKEDVNEDGTLKQGAEARATDAEGGETNGEGEQSANYDEEEALRQAREKLGEPHGETQTNADDVD